MTSEGAFRRTHQNLTPRFVREELDFAECPVEASLGVLGKKWSIVIIRDIGIYGQDRFHLLLKSLAGIPQKVLSTRLRELESEGFLRRSIERSRPPRVVRWTLTERGYDALRIGMMVAIFGARWHADRVFDDGRERTPRELYTSEGLELLLRGIVSPLGAAEDPRALALGAHAKLNVDAGRAARPGSIQPPRAVAKRTASVV